MLPRDLPTAVFRKYRGLVQFALYGFVGGIAFLADFGTLTALYRGLGVHYLTAGTCGFLAGTLVNYVLCKILVFKEEYRSKAVEFVLYCAIGGAGLALTDLFLWILAGRFEIPVEWSKIITTALVFLWNFLARKFFMYAGRGHLMKEETK